MSEQIAQIVAAGGNVYFKPTNFGMSMGIAVEMGEDRNGRMCEPTVESIEIAMQELFDWFVEQIAK